MTIVKNAYSLGKLMDDAKAAICEARGTVVEVRILYALQQKNKGERDNMLRGAMEDTPQLLPLTLNTSTHTLN